MDKDGSDYRVLHTFSRVDGEHPLPLDGFAVDGRKLYGTTRIGGAHGLGTVFRFVVPEPAAAVLLALAVAILLASRGHRSA